MPLIELDRDARGIAIDGDGCPADARDLQLRRARIKRREQMPVLDVVAEGVEADVRGGEGDFRRAQEPLRVVDDADGNERRGMRQAVLPYAERRQRGDRAGEQRGGAVIVLRLTGDKQRIDAARRERDRAHEAGRSAADDRDFGGPIFPRAVHECHALSW